LFELKLITTEVKRNFKKGQTHFVWIFAIFAKKKKQRAASKLYDFFTTSRAKYVFLKCIQGCFSRNILYN